MIAADQYSLLDPLVDPSNLTEQDIKTLKLRLSLITEEFFELFEASVASDVYTTFDDIRKQLMFEISVLETNDIELNLVEIADAIVDQDYINSGMAVWLDLPVEECFQLAHVNNMTKVDSTTGKVIRSPEGKILKPANFVPLDLTETVTQLRRK